MEENNEIMRRDVESHAVAYMDKLQKFEMIAFHTRGIMSSVSDFKRAAAEVELQRVQLDFQLNALLIKAQSDLESKRLFVPVIGNQLDRIQDRIDKFSDKLIDMMDDFSADAMEKQRLLLEFIEGQNDKLQQLSFNLMK